MPADVNIAPIAALLSDPTRVNVLIALSDGRALPAGELARRARVAPSTASAHLAMLVEHGILAVKRQGRHRYFHLADPAIVQAMEMLAVMAPPAPIHSLRESEIARSLHFARTCYDHLAGTVGVGITQALVEQKLLTPLDDGYSLTADGAERLQRLGIDCAVAQCQRRPFAPHHIDWSARRHHLAGALGSALARRLFELDWIARTPASRAVRVTDAGRRGLQEQFGLHLSNTR